MFSAKNRRLSLLKCELDMRNNEVKTLRNENQELRQQVEKLSPQPLYQYTIKQYTDTDKIIMKGHRHFINQSQSCVITVYYDNGDNDKYINPVGMSEFTSWTRKEIKQ